MRQGAGNPFFGESTIRHSSDAKSRETKSSWYLHTQQKGKEKRAEASLPLVLTSFASLRVRLVMGYSTWWCIHREAHKSYRRRIRSTQLLLQTINISLGDAGLVGVVEANNATHAEEGRNEDTEVEETLAGRDVGVLLGTEDTKNFILLVDGLAKVSLLLRIPPAAVGVSESTLHAGRILVATILPLPLDHLGITTTRKTLYL